MRSSEREIVRAGRGAAHQDVGIASADAGQIGENVVCPVQAHVAADVADAAVLGQVYAPGSHLPPAPLKLDTFLYIDHVCT